MIDIIIVIISGLTLLSTIILNGIEIYTNSSTSKSNIKLRTREYELEKEEIKIEKEELELKKKIVEKNNNFCYPFPRTKKKLTVIQSAE